MEFLKSELLFVVSKFRRQDGVNGKCNRIVRFGYKKRHALKEIKISTRGIKH